MASILDFIIIILDKYICALDVGTKMNEILSNPWQIGGSLGEAGLILSESRLNRIGVKGN